MECRAGFKLLHFLCSVCFIFYISCICLYVAFVEKLTSSLHFALILGSFSQLTGVDHSTAVLSPLVSVLDIIDAQATLFRILFHHLFL